MQITTTNPATEEVLKTYPIMSTNHMMSCIDSAHIDFSVWRTTHFSQRSKRMSALGALLRREKLELAQLMAKEMGKPITAGQSEVEKCAWVCEHFATQAEQYLSSYDIKTDMSKTKVCYQPLGVIFAIMPWNFPCWQVFRFAVPTLMAGNAAIIKHAPITMGTGNAIAELFKEAGFSEHLFQHFIIDTDQAAEVIAHDKIVGVSLTGSEKAGAAVGANAAKHLKKSVLELGGNDPYLVLADADLDLAAECIVTSRMSNSGQVCIAAKRTIVDASISEKLIEKIQEKLHSYIMGDPLDPSTNFGPLARKDLRDKLHEQVLTSIDKGAQLLLGGTIPTRKGFYYPPTMLTNVEPGMPAFDDELFGPVIAIITAKDEQNAIELANHTKFGLGAAIFTKDISRGEKIATEDIHAGSCFVNSLVMSDPRVPFGGIKHSGYGRELAKAGILEFVNIKTVSIK